LPEIQFFLRAIAALEEFPGFPDQAGGYVNFLHRGIDIRLQVGMPYPALVELTPRRAYEAAD
jgi:hypothetical protein